MQSGGSNVKGGDEARNGVKEGKKIDHLAAIDRILESTGVTTSTVNPSTAEEKDTAKLRTGGQTSPQTSLTTSPTRKLDVQPRAGSLLNRKAKAGGKGKGSVTFETGNAGTDDLSRLTAPVVNMHVPGTDARNSPYQRALFSQGGMPGGAITIEEIAKLSQQYVHEAMQQQSLYGNMPFSVQPGRSPGEATLHGTKVGQDEEDPFYASVDDMHIVSPADILQQQLNGILTSCRNAAKGNFSVLTNDPRYQAAFEAIAKLDNASDEGLDEIIASIKDNQTLFPMYEDMTRQLGASDSFVAPSLSKGRLQMPLPTQDNSRLIAFLKQDYLKAESYLQRQLEANKKPAGDSKEGQRQALLVDVTLTKEYQASEANLNQLQLLKLAESEDQITQESLIALIEFLTTYDNEHPDLALGILEGDHQSTFLTTLDIERQQGDVKNADKAALYKQCLEQRLRVDSQSSIGSRASEHGAGDAGTKEEDATDHHIVHIYGGKGRKDLITLLDPKKQQLDWYVLGGLAALFTAYNSMRLVPSLREDEGSAKTDGMIVEIVTAVMLLAIFAYHAFRFTTVYQKDVAKQEKDNRKSVVSSAQDIFKQPLVEYRKWPLKSLPAKGYLSQLWSYITKNPTQKGLNHVIEMIDEVVKDINDQHIPWSATIRSLDGSETTQDVTASNQTVVQLLHLRDILNNTLSRQKRFHQGERNVIGLVLQAIIGISGLSFSVVNATHMSNTGVTNTFVALNSLVVLSSLLVFYSLRPSEMSNEDWYNLLQRENYLAEARIEMSNIDSDIAFNKALNVDDQAFVQASDKIIDDLAVAALEIYRNHRDHLRDLLSNGRVRSTQNSTGDMQREFIRLIDSWFQTQIEVLIARASLLVDVEGITQKRDDLLTRLNQLRKSLVVMVSLDRLVDQDLESSLSTNAALTNAITALLSKLGSVSYNNLTDDDTLDGSEESKTLINRRRTFVESYINLMVSKDMTVFQELFNALNEGENLAFESTGLAPFALYNRDVIKAADFNFSNFGYAEYLQYAMYFHANDGCNDGKFTDNQRKFMENASSYLVNVLGSDADRFESPLDILVALVSNAPDDYANLAMQSIINADDLGAAFLVAVNKDPEDATGCGTIVHDKSVAACAYLGGLFSRCFTRNTTPASDNVNGNGGHV